MNVDFLTLACLKQDIERLQDAKIQQLLFSDDNTVALELYAGLRTTLLLDVSTQHSRAWLQQEKARRGVETETPLLLLLRKYVRRGRLRSVEQPAWERILRFNIESKVGRTTLVAEVMGRYSNLLLLNEDGVVMECVRRVGAQQNRYRVTLPNHPYESPPPLQKKKPTALDEGDWRMILAANNAKERLHRVLVRQLAGVSPTVGREISARATGDPNSSVAEADARSLQQVVRDLFAPLQTGEWAPHVALNEEGVVIAFAPYELTHFETLERVATISEAMQRFFAAKMDSDAYASARRQMAELLANASQDVNRRLYQLRSQTIDSAEVERLRENGELLLAYQWQVPKEAKEVEVPDFEGNLRRISLDASLSPLENAQRLFKRYEKKKRAAKEVPPRIQAAEQDLAFLQQLANDIEQAEERSEIDAVREALEVAGFVKKKKRKATSSYVRGPRRVLLGDWVAFVGRNAQQNDEVTFRYGASDDLWFHVRGVPGSHVILKSAGREVAQEIIERAASLAAYYSQARGNNQVAVDMTQRRHVRRISGARPGLVSYRNESTLYAKPMSTEEVEDSMDSQAVR